MPRQDIRFPTAISASTVTTGAILNFVIPAVPGQCIYVTGLYQFNDVPGTGVKGMLLDSLTATLYLVGFIATDTTVSFFNPIRGVPGNSVTFRTSTSGAHTINACLQYYYDDK